MTTMSDDNIKSFSSVIIEALKMKGMSVEKLSQLSGVPENVISLILDEKFGKLPAAPYVHGYIMKIGEVLGVDGEEVWTEYLKNKNDLKRSGEKDVLPPNRFEIPKVNKKMAGVIIVAVLIVLYLGFRLPSIMGSPALTFKDLSNGITVTKDQNFTIKGSVSPGDELTVNGESVLPDKDGGFEKTVVLNPGFNTFNFTATRVLGKTFSTTKQIYYQTESGLPLTEPTTTTSTASGIEQSSTNQTSSSSH